MSSNHLQSIPPSFTFQSQRPPSYRSARTDETRSTEPVQAVQRENNSLDFTQRIEKKFAEHNASENVFKRWLLEILSWLVSASSMIGVVAIYVWLKDKPLSQAGILLSIANALGKVASAALIVPTSEALGQLKWNWFHNSRGVWDFEIFDKASRGPWGAVMLLFRTRGRSLAALGALLIVLLLAIDTFFQQVVELPDRWSLNEMSGAISRAVVYDPPYWTEYKRGLEQTRLEIKMSPIIKEFFFANGTTPTPFGNGTKPDIPLSCPTSNCTWPTYETLAVCSSCKKLEASKMLTYACMNTTLDWTAHHTGRLATTPNGTVCGFFLNATSEAPYLMSGFIVNKTSTGSVAGEALVLRAMPLTEMWTKERFFGSGSIGFPNKRNTLMDSLIVSAPNGTGSVYRGESPIIHECVLSWCVQTLKSSYASGRYDEEVISAFENTTAGPAPWEITQLDNEEQWIVYKENVSIEAPRLHPQRMDATIYNTTYGVNNVTLNTILNIFDDFFPTSFTADNISARIWHRYKNYPIGPTVREAKFNPWQEPNNVTQYMERLATAITNVIRSVNSRETIAGTAYNRETYISIRWGWLAFPCTLLILTLIFLVSTIIKTSKDTTTGMWKTSTMPTLIYGLPKETQGQFTSSKAWTSGKGASQNTRIKLMPDMGWRVSGLSHLSRSPRLPSGERVPRGWI